jgi:glycosyltransferase involved in cell wall biosynthesis
MRILQVCQRYYPDLGGLEEHVRSISERLAQDHDVTVATTDSSGKMPKKTELNGVEVLRFKSWAPGEAYFLSFSLRQYLIKNSKCFDIVHTHGYSTFTSVFAASAKNENKLVFTPHYHGKGHTRFRALLHKPYKRLGKRVFDAADKIICVSNYERGMIFEDFKAYQEKTVMIPNGVNLSEFSPLEKKSRDDRLVLYVGRLEKYKGVQYLIEVLPHIDSEIRLKIIGKGPYRDKLILLTKRLRLENRVTFLHDLSRAELLREYAGAGLCALLSEHEAFGLSVAESLCAGTPVVVADTSALTEWIDEQNCFGVKFPITLSDLAATLSSVIGKEVKNPKVRDWDEIASMTSNLYEICLSG